MTRLAGGDVSLSLPLTESLTDLAAAEEKARGAGLEGLMLQGAIASGEAADELVRAGYLPVAGGWWRRVVPLPEGVNRSADDELRMERVEHGTLLFLIVEDRMLLIHKRRGHGAGQVNGPGGRREAGEAPLATAIREMREETGLSPRGVRRVGSINFVDADASAMIGHIYRADAATGQVAYGDEALPFWCTLDAIPYGRMWPDDRLWLPWLLAGRRFDIDILTRGDEIAGQRTRFLDDAPP